jgi:predicted anti-sigma-YlaC factor YlaD
MSEEQFAAESDKSPGVLLASGYIAGGAIAGILIAFLAGVLGDFDAAVGRWAEKNNPFFAGPHADLLALLPFAAIAVFLYLVARERVLGPRRN